MQRPRIKSPCVADHYHGAGERIAEFSFPDGSGGLLRLQAGGLDSQGRDRPTTLMPYRLDDSVRVRVEFKFLDGEPQRLLRAAEAILAWAIDTGGWEDPRWAELRAAVKAVGGKPPAEPWVP